MAVGIFGGLVVIVIYTMIGGMWAVALTDFVQVVMLTIGLVVLLIIVLDDVGGWSTVVERLPKDTVRFFPVEHSYKNWIEYIHVWMTLGIAAIAANTVIQRALSANHCIDDDDNQACRWPLAYSAAWLSSSSIQ